MNPKKDVYKLYLPLQTKSGGFMIIAKTFLKIGIKNKDGYTSRNKTK